MAAERLSMRQIREILRQKWALGLSHRPVVFAAADGQALRPLLPGHQDQDRHRRRRRCQPLQCQPRPTSGSGPPR
jgi:hypothetical protein